MRAIMVAGRLMLPVVLGLGVGFFVTGAMTGACAPPPHIQSPEAKVAYTADQVAVRINELQATAIKANAEGALSVNDTRRIVQFCVAANKALKDTPAGWQKAVASAWQEVRRDLPPTNNEAVRAALVAIDVVLATAGA